MNDLLNRMIRAAKLDAQLYEEVEADPSATGPAMAVVAISSIAAGLGSGQDLGGIVLGAIFALVGWFIWALTVYLIGTKILPQAQTSADLGQLLRTIGFSSSPGVLRVLGFIPGLGLTIVFLANVWMLVAMVIAVRQALDYDSTWRAFGVCLLGWLFYFLILVLLGGLSAMA